MYIKPYAYQSSIDRLRVLDSLDCFEYKNASKNPDGEDGDQRGNHLSPVETKGVFYAACQ